MKRVAIVLMVVGILGLGCSKKTEPVLEKSKSDTPGQAFQFNDSEIDPNFKVASRAKRQLKYFPEGTPTRAIQDLDDLLESYILNPKTPEDKKYNDNLKSAVIHGTFDIRELCRLALDKNWNERTKQEQEYFVQLMTHLLEKKAIFSKEQGQKGKSGGGGKELYSIRYEGDQFLNPEKTQAQTRSLVSIPSENLKIEISYKLKKLDGSWRIYDVIVDGASLLDNYKYQFDKIIAKDGYPTLVHRMESKLKAIGDEATNSLAPAKPDAR